ncbi:transaldolase family protein [Acetobacterium sp.]|uniref:transaldolase family protein n=1 Tax=Acetobacterium sp. TaxID=1872094 RepID=UPI000CB1DCAD|nr:transaldolase family protein [Acetobacterium sp.]MDO9491749.1 transaldolase family protein [Acetobacterium sp.]PKM74263.1 MAG: transaldolase [Firmicutes bacterium HGW-Firmicutes-17]
MKTVSCTLNTLLNDDVSLIDDQKSDVSRVLDFDLPLGEYDFLKKHVKKIGVTKEFSKVISTFKTPENETPEGFRVEYRLESNGILRADLIRDISYDKNGKKRPTNVLFSADSANPYEVKPISKMIANLTCNPGIIYDLFINNPKANIGNQFKTRDEVMEEIGRILGPGADISVELNDPFGKSDTELLEEAEKFKEMLSEYRVVIKVPHTGPVTNANVSELLSGNKKLGKSFTDVTTEGAFRGHNLALMLKEHGFRVNFTLMFEPYQTALALQAKPYFVNSFIRHRLMQSESMELNLKQYNATGDLKFIKNIQDMFFEKDYLNMDQTQMDLLMVKKMAEDMLRYRHFDDPEGSDGLDSVRHNLRLFKNTNLDDTRLIICSMEGELNYPDIDKLLVEKEFEDLVHRVVITAEPKYLARFTSCNQVVSYQRRFMNAANGQK